MRLNHYQREATRTLPSNTEPGEALNLGALGLGGESGEVIDLIKKHLFHEQPLDVDKLRKELGDVLWYVSAIATGASLTLEEIAEANVEKLRKRYPEGFSPAASVAKADEQQPGRAARFVREASEDQILEAIVKNKIPPEAKWGDDIPRTPEGYPLGSANPQRIVDALRAATAEPEGWPGDQK